MPVSQDTVSTIYLSILQDNGHAHIYVGCLNAFVNSMRRSRSGRLLEEASQEIQGYKAASDLRRRGQVDWSVWFRASSWWWQANNSNDTVEIVYSVTRKSSDTGLHLIACQACRLELLEHVDELMSHRFWRMWRELYLDRDHFRFSLDQDDVVLMSIELAGSCRSKCSNTSIADNEGPNAKGWRIGQCYSTWSLSGSLHLARYCSQIGAR